MAPVFAMPATPPTLFDLPAVARHTGTGQRHTVRSGETVFGLALHYHTTTSAIAQANNLANTRLIRPGDVLVIPSGATSAVKRPARSVSSHPVRAGETLSSIAVRYGTSVAALAKANGISPTRFILPGQRLSIPGATTRVDRSFESSTKTTTRTPNRAGISRSATRDLIVATANRYGVDHRLALAIAWQESGWNQGVTSHAGAVGTMQVMSASGTWASRLINHRLDIHDQRDNVTAGIVIIRQLTKMASSRDEVIAAYYQGLASVRARGWYADTRQYVANVNYFRQRL